MAIIEQPTEFRKKQYDQATPIPAKFLHADGTVDENIGSGGGDLEEKSVTITSNGTVNITPSEGKDGMSKVVATVNVGGGGKLFAYSTNIPDPYFEIKSALMYSTTEITEPGDYNFCQPKSTTSGDYYFLIEKYTVSVTSVDSDGNITDSDDMTYDRVADKDITL